MSEAALRERIDELEEEVRQLRGATHGSPDLRYMIAFKISSSEAQLLDLLMREPGVSKKFLADQHSHLEQPWKLFDKRMHDLRRKLKKHDIYIDTVWGQGYHMTGPNRERVKAIVEAVK